MLDMNFVRENPDAVKEALTDRYPRDRYTLTTKLHASYLKKKEDRDRFFGAGQTAPRSYFKR